MIDRRKSARSRHVLSALGVAVIVLCAVHVPLDYGPASADVLEVLVPVAISLALIAFSVRLRRVEYGSDQVRRIAAWSVAGVVASAVVGGWWIVLRLGQGLPVSGVSHQVITLLSFGVGAGAVAGRCRARRDDPPHRETRERREARPRGRSGTRDDRGRPAAETTWIDREERAPIGAAVLEAIADLEGTDPRRLEFTLYEHVDPEAVDALAAHDGAPWQLRFYADRYEVRIGSHGTVTVSARAEERTGTGAGGRG